MTPEVFGWNAASNNQLLVAGHASYILNSISAYRTAQKDQPEIGRRHLLPHAAAGPSGRRGRAGARARGLHLDDSQPLANTRTPPRNSSSIWSATTPPPASRASSTTSRPGRRRCPIWKAGSITTRTARSRPTSWRCLKTANDWTTNLGHPGPGQRGPGRDLRSADPAEHDGPRRYRAADRPRTRSPRRKQEINAIFEKWRAEGLMGGGAESRSRRGRAVEQMVESQWIQRKVSDLWRTPCADRRRRTPRLLDLSPSRLVSAMAVVEVRDLSKRFDGVAAVDGIDLRPRTGSSWCCWDPPGAARRRCCA